jgi:aspartate aminotransferase-like enzyme
LLSALRERHGVVLAGGQAELAGKIVRFGTMGEIGESDIRRAIDAIATELHLTSDVA